MSRNRRLTDLKNIGTKLASRLNEVGISSEADLRRIGAVGAHRRVQERYPGQTLPICYYLYSFEGALTDKHWNELSESRKRTLNEQVVRHDELNSDEQKLPQSKREPPPLFKKLNLGSINTILILNAPESFEVELDKLSGVSVLRKPTGESTVTFALGFATTQKELDQISSTFAKMTSGDVLIWIAYPKGTSKRFRCDFNRDTGWNVLGNAGFEPVRQVAIDEDWSALRFRRTEYIKSLSRSSEMAISSEGKRRTK